jgi:hypothetical protein
MQIQTLLMAAWGLLIVAGPAAALGDPPIWVIANMREKWTGLKGAVLKDGEQVDLPELLWEVKAADEPEGNDVLPKPIVPFRNNPRAVKQAPAKIEVAEPVVLRIRGKKVEYTRRGSRSTTIRSDHDDRYLAYDANDDALQLLLTAKPGKGTQWRVVDAEQGLSKGRGEYQYVLEQTVKFRLEAVGRPGWFLGHDDERGLILSADAEKKCFIEMEVEKRYDDHSDGK